MSDEADKNRTFDKFSADMWPPIRRNPNRSGGDGYYTKDAYFEAKRLDDYARAAGAFYVYQRTGQELNRVRVQYRPGQTLIPYSTKWELAHSTLFAASKKTVEPIVDNNYTLVAHYGWFWASDILIPKGILPERLEALLARGISAFADKLNPMPGSYGTAYMGAPEIRYLVVTNPEGEVLGVVAAGTSGNAISTTPPWEYIMLGKALINLAKGGVRLAVTTLVRRGTKEIPIITGPTLRGAEKVLREEEKQLVKSEAEAARKSAGETLRGVGIAPRTPFRRLVGRLTPTQITEYFRELLANRPDLRRLMAARVMTGQGRMDAIKIALKEFENTQPGWRVVEKTAAEMEAVTTPNNLVMIRTQTKELWINTERANRWDPDVFYDEVVHDLSAHALAGRGSSELGISLKEADLPFVGSEFVAKVTDGCTLLERSIKLHGNIEWIVKFFGR